MKHFKQWHRVAVIAVFLSLMCYVKVGAFDFSVNNIYYNINEKTLTAEVTYSSDAYNSYSGQVVIPATVTSGGKTYNVAAVGENAFRDCTGLTAVTFGANVATIGKRAFLNCSALSAITITEAITEIGDYAFAQCGGLNIVTMNNDAPLQLGNGTFLRCSSLTNVKWQSSENLEGRGGVVAVGTNAFAHCTSLSSIVLPGVIEQLGTSIFDGCTGLTSITVTAEQPLLLSGDPFGLSGSATIYVPSSGQAGVSASLYQNAVGWRDYTIAELPYSFIDSDGYTYLKTSAGAVALNGSQTARTNVDVRNSITGYSGENYHVTSISDQAFKSRSIVSVNTSDAYNLKTIGYESFAGCASLANVTLAEGITTMGERAFASCTTLKTIKLPSTLRTVAKGAFDGCASLKNVTLQFGVTTIREDAFAHCTGLFSLRLPRSISSVEAGAFRGATALEDIFVDSGNRWYGDIEGVLYERKYIEGMDPEESQLMNKLVLYPSNREDEALYIPPSVTEIKAYAIQNAPHLKTVAVPPATTVFGDNCFDGTAIEYLNYRSKSPSEEGTSGITAALKAGATLQVPEGATGNYLALAAWQGFKAIVERYDVYDDNKFVYDWNNGNGMTLVDIKPAAVDASGLVALPATRLINGKGYFITELRNTATAQVAQQVKNLKIDCDSLAVIDLTDNINPLAVLTSLEAISISAKNLNFKIIDNILYNYKGNKLYYYLHSKSQEEFSLPSAVDTIMPMAFAYNDKLKVFKADSHLKLIGNRAFEWSTKLHTIDKLKTVTKIGSRAFANCLALTTVNGCEQLSSIGDEAFLRCGALRQFPFCNGVITAIGSRAFKECTSLTVAVLGRVLKSVGDGAFEGCTSLSKAFVTSEASLGDHLFKGCSSLSELWLSSNTPSLVGNDFFETPASVTLYVPQEAISAYHSTSPWSSTAQINACQYIYNGADVNNDKYINAYDITVVMSVLLGVEDVALVGNCDVNGDGVITAADITIIYDYILTGVDTSVDYRFVNSKDEGIGHYMVLAEGAQQIRAIKHDSSNYVASGLNGVSDNASVAGVTMGTIQGAQCINLMPNALGYFTLVAIVNDGSVSHYCAYPIVVR